MEVKLVFLDRDDGRAEVILGSPDGTRFVITRDGSGTGGGQDQTEVQTSRLLHARGDRIVFTFRPSP